MVDRHRVRQLFGESMREAGILVLVFGPLDELIQPTHPNAGSIAAFALSGLIFTALGTMIEARQ